ncbi:hypothetical protein [Emticicia fontis]
MKEEKSIVNIGGRGITTYLPEYDEQAYKICLLGATLNKWMKKYPGFREAIKKAKLLADANVAGSLYKRAVGYNYQQVVLEPIQESSSEMTSEKVVATVTTFLPEDIDGFRSAKVTTKANICMPPFLNGVTIENYPNWL